MTDLPYFQMWPRDYLADTRHLTTEQHGAYFLLMLEAWMRPECSLPDDDAILARLCCMSDEEWKANKDVIMAFWTFKKRSKIWVQKRLQKEHEKAGEKRRKARDSAASRWKGSGKSDANALRTQCSPESRKQKNTNVSFQSAGARKTSGFVKPRTALDAAVSFIERKGLTDEPAGTGGNREIVGNDVQLLPPVRSGRR